MTGPMILGLLGAALAAWQWFAGRVVPPPVALPDREPGVNHSSPTAWSFVEAVDAYDVVRSFVGGRMYPPDEARAINEALRTLRLALIAPPAVNSQAALGGSNHPAIPPSSPEARA